MPCKRMALKCVSFRLTCLFLSLFHAWLVGKGWRCGHLCSGPGSTAWAFGVPTLFRKHRGWRRSSVAASNRADAETPAPPAPVARLVRVKNTNTGSQSPVANLGTRAMPWYSVFGRHAHTPLKVGRAGISAPAPIRCCHRAGAPAKELVNQCRRTKSAEQRPGPEQRCPLCPPHQPSQVKSFWKTSARISQTGY